MKQPSRAKCTFGRVFVIISAWASKRAQGMVRSPRLACAGVVVCLCLVSLGCGTQRGGGNSGSAESGRAALRIGGDLYSRLELESFFQTRLDEFPAGAEADDARSALLENFIEEKLLLAAAQEHDIRVEPAAVQAALKILVEGRDPAPTPAEIADLEHNVEDGLKVQQYLNRFVLGQVRVTEEECRQYYEEHLEDFVRNDVVRVREILVGDQAQAAKVQALLKAGQNRNFGELARLYSKSPTAALGGEMGSFQRGELPDRLEKVIFALAPGTVSRTVATEFGYHIFLVEEKIQAHQQRYYEARSEIEERLLLERRRRAIDDEVESLAKKTPIEIYGGQLGFRYTGTRYASAVRSGP